MFPYVLLITFIFLVAISTKFIKDEAKRHNVFTSLTFLYLYIFCVIRSFNVGIDIPGYISMYNETAKYAWNNWNFVYFENGYITLMKICNILGLSDRGFFYVVYAIILLPIYLFIKKYSVNPFISLILYISFIFFTFDLTGLRQAIAMPICLVALMVILSKCKYRLIWFIALVYLAMSFHTSSIVFLPAYFIIKLKVSKKTLLLAAAAIIACYLLNKVGVQYILQASDKTKYEYSDGFKLGSSLILYFIFAICSLIARPYLKNNSSDFFQKLNDVCFMMLLASIASAFLFNGSILLRANMYYLQVFIISVPLFFKSLDKTGRAIGECILVTVMLTHFFVNELNTFNVTPYEIGKEQRITK